MRRRPLCFLCIVLVVLNYIFLTSGDLQKSPDVLSFLGADAQSDITIYGEIYQCEYKEDKQIIYLKQAVLSKGIQSKNIRQSTKDTQYRQLDGIRITCPIGGETYKIGDEVTAFGVLKEISPATNPGQFDSQSYYAGKKIDYTMWEPEITLIGRPKIHVQRSLYDLRSHFSEIITECIQYDSIGGILRGIVLGDKSDISEETKKLYQIGGISHILAISAMHLTILGNGLYGILKRCGVPLRIAGSISGIFLTAYGILTGASVATVRALIMFLLNIGAEFSGRTCDSKTSLSLAAVLLLSGNPLSLTDSGFLLSFSAMISFSLFREKRKIGSSILLYLFMTPVTLWLFYEIPLYSVLINFLVVPTLAVVLLSGVGVCLLGSINLLLGRLASVPGLLLLSFYEVLCKLASNMPYARLVLGKPSVVGIILFYGVMLLTLWLYRKYRLSWKRFFLFFLMIPATLVLVYHPGGRLQITALDVGQGDCIVIETPQHHAFLIDGGSSSVQRVGNYRIWPYLKYRGIHTLDAVFVTHPDGDHINGIIELMEMIEDKNISLQIKRIVLPVWEDMTPFSEVTKLAENVGIQVIRMGQGDCFIDGDVHMECIYPAKEDFSDRTNEGSLVLEVTYHTFTGLLTGDLEGKGEEEILSSVSDVDYLKVAHHGSGNSTYEPFLKKTKPEISMISCGRDNLYGHPHKNLLSRLEAVDSDVYGTQDYGAIWIITDGVEIDLHTFCKYNESNGLLH